MFPDFRDNVYNQLIGCFYYNPKTSFPMYKSTVPPTAINFIQFFPFQGCH